MASAATEQVTFRDAIGNVEVLDEMALPDSQPCVEALSQPVQYRVSFDTNFEDRNAYVTGISKYMEEAARHAQLNEMLAEGFQHAVHLYTWRCCSRAIPLAKSNDQPNRVEIYEKTVEVLQPEVTKLLHFMYFAVSAVVEARRLSGGGAQNNAIVRFCDEARRLCHPEKRRDFVSEAYLLTLGKFINMFAVLDELKNMKASIKNDYSTYRRAAQHRISDSQALQESQNLSMFLATHNKIREALRTELHKIDGYEDLLADVLNLCAFLYENRMYITPEEKHMLVKVLGFGLYLIDGEGLNLAKLEQKKRINVPKMDKIFKTLEVLPLFGDMQITPFAFVTKCANYDASRWPHAPNASDRCHVNVVERLRRVREDHTDYVTHLSRIHNEMAVYDKDGPRNDVENREITELALRGLQLLCAWTSDVLELYSWKLLNPIDQRSTDCPQEAEEYERATRYNYSPDEKGALIEIISMIKGLQTLLGKMEAEFNEAIRRHVYAELQDFVQISLREPMRKAAKNKKDLIRGIFQSVCDTVADPLPGDDHGEVVVKGQKKDTSKGSTADVRIQKRPVAPSSTQLYMARTMLESLLTDRSSGTKTAKKDIDEKFQVVIKNFLRMSYFWPPLLSFAETLEKCCDLSQLWYREFYLEMTMGKRIQTMGARQVPFEAEGRLSVLRGSDGAVTGYAYRGDGHTEERQPRAFRFEGVAKPVAAAATVDAPQQSVWRRCCCCRHVPKPHSITLRLNLLPARHSSAGNSPTGAADASFASETMQPLPTKLVEQRQPMRDVDEAAGSADAVLAASFDSTRDECSGTVASSGNRRGVGDAPPPQSAVGERLTDMRSVDSTVNSASRSWSLIQESVSVAADTSFLIAEASTAHADRTSAARGAVVDRSCDIVEAAPAPSVAVLMTDSTVSDECVARELSSFSDYKSVSSTRDTDDDCDWDTADDAAGDEVSVGVFNAAPMDGRSSAAPLDRCHSPSTSSKACELHERANVSDSCSTSPLTAVLTTAHDTCSATASQDRDLMAVDSSKRSAPVAASPCQAMSTAASDCALVSSKAATSRLSATMPATAATDDRNSPPTTLASAVVSGRRREEQQLDLEATWSDRASESRGAFASTPIAASQPRALDDPLGDAGADLSRQLSSRSHSSVATHSSAVGEPSEFFYESQPSPGVDDTQSSRNSDVAGAANRSLDDDDASIAAPARTRRSMVLLTSDVDDGADDGGGDLSEPQTLEEGDWAAAQLSADAADLAMEELAEETAMPDELVVRGLRHCDLAGVRRVTRGARRQAGRATGWLVRRMLDGGARAARARRSARIFPRDLRTAVAHDAVLRRFFEQGHVIIPLEFIVPQLY